MIASNEYRIAEYMTFFSKGFLKHRLWLGQAGKPHCTSSERAGEHLLWDGLSLSRSPGPEEAATGREVGADLTHMQKPPCLGDVSSAGSKVRLAVPHGIQPG